MKCKEARNQTKGASGPVDKSIEGKEDKPKGVLTFNVKLKGAKVCAV